MVKMPSFDDLKKMGADLMETAKSIKFDEVVDKVKSGVESVSAKYTSAPIPQGDEVVKNLFEEIQKSLNELSDTQSVQAVAIKKIQGQFVELARVIDVRQKAAADVKPAETNHVNIETEENKNETK